MTTKAVWMRCLIRLSQTSYLNSLPQICLIFILHVTLFIGPCPAEKWEKLKNHPLHSSSPLDCTCFSWNRKHCLRSLLFSTCNVLQTSKGLQDLHSSRRWQWNKKLYCSLTITGPWHFFHPTVPQCGSIFEWLPWMKSREWRKLEKQKWELGRRKKRKKRPKSDRFLFLTMTQWKRACFLLFLWNTEKDRFW